MLAFGAKSSYLHTMEELSLENELSLCDKICARVILCQCLYNDLAGMR